MNQQDLKVIIKNKQFRNTASENKEQSRIDLFKI